MPYRAHMTGPKHWSAEAEPHPGVKPLQQVEREHILATMEAFPGNKSLVARSLGISLKTLYNKLNQYAAESSHAPVS